MKKEVHLISVLLVIILSLSLLGTTALADLISLSGGESLSVMIDVDRSDGNPGSYFDADGNEVYLNPDQVLANEVPTVVCSISVVDRSNQPVGGGYDSLSSLLYSDAGIRIEPVHDYYVSALSLTTGDGSSSKNLLTASTANLDSTAVTLFLRDIAEIDASGNYALNGDYVGGWGGGSYTLNVTCRKISPDVHTITYFSNGSQIDGISDYGAWTHTVRNIFNEVYAPDGMEPDYLLLSYDWQNGAIRKVNPGDPVSVYVDASIDLVWKQAEAVIEETYVEPDSMEEVWTDDSWDNNSSVVEEWVDNTPKAPEIPTVTIAGSDYSKIYDGSPLTVPDWESGYSIISGYLGDYYSLGVSFNTITDIGSVPTIANYALFDPYGNLAYDRDALDSSGVFTVIPGTLTVEPVPAPVVPFVTVTAVTDSKQYDGTPLTKDDSNGYSIDPADGLGEYRLWIAFNSITDVGSVDTIADYAICDQNWNVIFDRQALNESSNFSLINGTLTITEAPPPEPVIPTVTVSAVSDSKQYDGTPLTKDDSNGYSIDPADGLGEYQLWVSFNSITDVGSVDTIADYAICDQNWNVIFDRQALNESGNFSLINGTLTITEAPPPEPVIPTVTVSAVSDSKQYDGTPLTKDNSNGYSVDPANGLGEYRLLVSFNSITEVGSVATISDYALCDQSGTVIFDRQALDNDGNFNLVNGTLTITEAPPPEPVIPIATVMATSDSKQYDGTPLTKDDSNGYTVYPTNGLGDYRLQVTFNSITEVGSVATISDYALCDQSGTVIFDRQALDNDGNFNLVNGTLTITEAPPPEPVIPTVTVTAVSDSKQYDGTPLTKDSFNGYTVSPSNGLGNYLLQVTFNSITEVGSVATISDYALCDQSGTIVFSRQALDSSSNFTLINGTLTITTAPPPEPVIPVVAVLGTSDSKQYDGTPLTKDSSNGYTISPANGLGEYRLQVSFGSITDPGSTPTITDYALCNASGSVVFTKQQLDASPNFTIDTGTLTVTKRHLKITAISGDINSHGETYVASSLSSQDGSFKNGYKAEGLLSGHTITGVVVIGQGKTSFATSVITDNVRISDSSSWDVTNWYDVANIEKISGYITIHDLTPPSPNTYTLTVNPKSYTWVYDGQEHRLNEYDSPAGLVDGDRLNTVTFSNTSVIRDVGAVYNEITSVDVRTSSGADVAEGKYRLSSAPGLLRVTERSITVTAISGTLSNTGGKEIIASTLSKPDENFSSGYRVEGLAPGHTLSGNFVTGRGTTTFNTSIDLNQLRVLDAYGVDVTRNYRISTVSGVVTINGTTAPTRANVPLTITAKSGTFTYDGNEHSLNEYEVTGLVDGDRIDKVTFKSTSVIRNVGTQANEIQSVVIKSSTGVALDNSKYTIRYIPGTLTVTKFPLTLTAVSDSKAYDGKALNNKNVKASTLANSNHKLSADYEVFDSNGNTIKNGPVDPGTYTKKVSNVKITAGTQDVTANYDIKTIDGTLTITGTAGSSSTSNKSTTSTAYYGSTYTIRSDAPYSEFLYLLIDGQRVSSDNYTVKEGSTIITLKASYIQSLKTGNHNYTIVSASRQTDGTFNVAKAPRTADGSHTVIWIVVLLLAALAVAAAFFFLKRSGKLGGNPPRSNPPRSNSSRNTPSGVSGKQSEKQTASKPVQKAAAPIKAASKDDDVVTAESVLNFDSLDKASKKDEADPTAALVKDFELDLDSFRDPATQTTAEPTTTLPDIDAEVIEKQPRGRHEKI